MYLVVEVLTILERIHAAGFIHADIKPDNLILVDTPCLHASAPSLEEYFQAPSAVRWQQRKMGVSYIVVNNLI